jgi:hypothetical protein
MSAVSGINVPDRVSEHNGETSSEIDCLDGETWKAEARIERYHQAASQIASAKK